MMTPVSQVNFTLRSRAGRPSGQAMIEYLLVVTVTVIIIATLVQKMYKPMDRFVNNIMGNYVACLLETGQLPALGSVNEQEEGDGSCKIDMFADGASGKNKDKDKENDDADNADKIQNPPKRRSSASYAGGARGSGKAFNIPNKQNRGSSGIETGGRGDLGLPQGKSGGDFFASGYSSQQQRKRDRYVAIRGLVAEEVVKKKKDKDKGKISVPKSEAGGISAPPRKIAMIAPERKPRELADMNASGLDISGMVKIILIAGIIIILVVLIGGQAVSLSKNWEKGE